MMKLSIRSKLVFAISLLMVVLFSIIAILFIQEKKLELSEDIYFNSLSFSRFAAPDVLSLYNLYLVEDGFVNFKSEIGKMFEQSDSVKRIQLVDYSGGVVYDSEFDVIRKYEGEKRIFNDGNFEILRSENYGLKTLDGRMIFLKGSDHGYWYLDANENVVEPFERGELLEMIVVPVSEKFSVIFYLDYSDLEERVGLMMRRIVYLAMFGVLLGVMLSFVMSEQVTRSVDKLVFGAKKIAAGDFSTKVNIKTGDEIEYLGDAFNKMAEDLEVSIEAKIYKERVAKELELAKQIQDQILPDVKNLPIVNGLEMAADLIPAEEIGGDIYDFLKVDDNRLLFYLGDVTGHGVPAGIVSSIASALFYGYSNNENLIDLMGNVNKVLKVKTMPTMFLTLCLLYWNANENLMQYVSAGHEQIIHYRAKEKDVILEPRGGMALGMLPDVTPLLKLQNVDFQEGDILLIYSDGIPEAWGPNDELLGMDRLMVKVKELGNLNISVESFKEEILKFVRDFEAGHKQMDDITLIVVKKK